MDNIDLGIKTLNLIYKDFEPYFKSGDLIVGGSFYYKKIGCEVETEYKDIDLFVDNQNDKIFHEIMDLSETRYDLISSFRDKFDLPYMIGSFTINGYTGVDILRDDFSDLLPPVEIIPGVWSYGLSDKVMYEAYRKLEEFSPRDNYKYKEIKEFFQRRWK